MQKSFLATDNYTGFKPKGVLTWYSIPEDIMIKADLLKDQAKKFGLPEEYLPSEIRKVDAFKRATTKAIPPKRVAIVRVREIKTDDRDKLIRMYERLVSESNDTSTLKLKVDAQVQPEWEHIGTAVYNTRMKSVATIVQNKAFDFILREVENMYDMYSEYYEGNAIRTMTKDALHKMSSITMRKAGGIEFIPIQYEPVLESLSNLLKSISQDCEISTIPLIPRSDGEADDQGKLIHNKLIHEVTSNAREISVKLGISGTATMTTVQGLISQYATLLQSNQHIAKGKLNEAVKSFADNQKLITEYEGLLNTEMSGLKASVTVLQEQLKEMLKRVDVSS